MFVICYGNIVDGVSFVGPFLNHEDAVLYCEGYASQWNVIELSSPSDGIAGSLSTHFQEFADQLDEVASELEASLVGSVLVGPNEDTADYVQKIRAAESAMRSI